MSPTQKNKTNPKEQNMGDMKGRPVLRHRKPLGVFFIRSDSCSLIICYYIPMAMSAKQFLKGSWSIRDGVWSSGGEFEIVTA